MAGIKTKIEKTIDKIIGIAIYTVLWVLALGTISLLWWLDHVRIVW